MDPTVWDAVGAIGEILGALAVVATLIYLSIQVRHSKSAVEENTRVARIAVLDQHTQAQSQWRGRMADNGELTAIWVAAEEGGLAALDAVERERFIQHARDYFNVWRSSYAAALSVRHKEQCQHIARSCALGLHGNRGHRELWEDGARRMSGLVVPEFVEEVEERLRELDGLQSQSAPGASAERSSG